MYPFLIGWISYALCDWIFTYATNHAILCNAKIVQYKEFCFAVQKVISDSFIYCNLCSRVIGKKLRASIAREGMETIRRRK